MRPLSWLLLPAALLAGCGSALGQEDGSSTSAQPAYKGDTRGMEELLDRLESRERAIERREQSLASREALLRDQEAAIDAKLAELQALRDEVQEIIDEGDAAREARIDDLVKMIEKMRPKDSAALVTQLMDEDLELAVDVVDRISTTKGGKLLAAMEPKNAATLAERLTRLPLEGTR